MVKLILPEGSFFAAASSVDESCLPLRLRYQFFWVYGQECGLWNLPPRYSTFQRRDPFWSASNRPQQLKQKAKSKILSSGFIIFLITPEHFKVIILQC